MPRRAGQKLTACIKNMANMDIAERRASQDGKIRRKYNGEPMEFRCSSAPGKNGEKLVLRYLKNDPGILNLDTLITNETVRSQFREIMQRIQRLQRHAYAEVRDNLLADLCRPIDLLRCKLAMFGATKFDPKSDLWIRITLFQGAPLKEQLNPNTADNWLFPSHKNGF